MPTKNQLCKFIRKKKTIKSCSSFKC
jgi:hypothetical protein